MYFILFLLTIIMQAGTKKISAINIYSKFNDEHILTKLNVLFQKNSNDSAIDADNDCPDYFAQLAREHGYSAEKHEVETEDGYWLNMFRIPNKGPAVLLIHGFISSSDEFVTIGSQALPYQLADNGYDVWLANNRGNKYSLRHATLPTDSAAYWDFSWDEMGRYDMPAFIDYILKETNAKDLKFIAHSQGTALAFVLLSERPEYNNKLSMTILMSPTGFYTHTRLSFIRLLAGPLSPDLYELGKSIGLYSLFTDYDIGPFVSQYKKNYCATPETADFYCHDILFSLFGPDPNQVNTTRLPVIYKEFPTSISIKQAQHHLQLIRSLKFRQYDYGKDINSLKYCSPDPPEYVLQKITTKVAVLWASNDWLCGKDCIELVLSKLPNVIDVYQVPNENFCHTDYIYAKDAKSLVYDKVLEILDSNK